MSFCFVILFQGSWMNKTPTGSEEVQQSWQTEAIFQHKETILRISVCDFAHGVLIPAQIFLERC